VSDYWLVIVALVIALGALSFIPKLRPKGALPIRARPLMTPREREVIKVIEEALPHCRVHAQVAMGALIDCKKDVPRNQRRAVRNRFDRKVIDFVVEDRSNGNVLALIELDDRTHNAAKDRGRDAITAAAGLRTIRLPAGERPDFANIRMQVNQHARS
jgi:hypothetical protein